MRILHSADWHLDAAFAGLPSDLGDNLRGIQRSIPERIVKLCKQHDCQLLLLSGDLFDKEPGRDTLEAVCAALGALDIPVLISPGNHDFYRESGAYAKKCWPKNVHIFSKPRLEAFPLPELDCIVYGAGYESMDCPGLLEGFRGEGSERYAIGLLHADPTRAASPYCPMTAAQVRDSGLDYLALGHIHRTGSFRSGSTLCAWPGCPMGRGFDETGSKGVLLVELEQEARAAFLPLGLPQFFDLEVDAQEDPQKAVLSRLPAGGGQDVFRITLTGVAEPSAVAAIPPQGNLILRDRTVSPGDLWGSMEQDNLEGLYFRLLHDAQDPALGRLAAELSRQLLDGREVLLP